jgi:hypothetical protein
MTVSMLTVHLTVIVALVVPQRVGPLYLPSEARQPIDHLVAIQRNHALVEENPEEWMPWNYADTLAGLALAG